MNARLITASLAFSLSTAFATAQSQVVIGDDGVGCTESGARLDDGTPVRANVTFAYDAANALLTVTVDNTTPILPGIASPTITRVYFNSPTGAVTGAELISQSAGGLTQPNFVFGFDANANDGNDPNRAGCLGNFNFRLASSGIQDGIAPGRYETICSDSKDPPVVGPATFEFLLFGPDVANLTSEVFAASSSYNALMQSVNVAAKFEGAGCEGSGTVGNGDVCRQAVFLRGNPRLNQTVRLCVVGGNRCRSWFGISTTPGPIDFKWATLPIGVPVLFTYDFGYFPANSHEFYLEMLIPFAPELIDAQFFMTSFFHPFEMDGPYGFAPAYDFTVLGLEQLPQ